MEEFERNVIPHLRSQFERVGPVLFIGAGFSHAGKNVRGGALPLLQQLHGPLSELCFPGVPLDDSNAVGDLFEHARLRHGRQLDALLNDALSVDPSSLPDWYQLYFHFPWHRCYTLNFDTLPDAVSQRFALPRRIETLSATTDGHRGFSSDPEVLQVVHLNGRLSDGANSLTVSDQQYAERLARQEPWFFQLVNELMSRPVVFIGTRLDEPTLWQHIQFRRTRGSRELDDLRPKSYLVTPTLPPARAALLAEHRIQHLPLTAEQFATSVLLPLKGAAEVGLRLLASRRTATGSKTLEDVSNLATSPSEDTDFLIGAEPRWSDIQSGRAAIREFDSVFQNLVDRTMAGEGPRGVVVLTGTAGSGKTVSLMRACLRLHARGLHVAWVSEDMDFRLRDLRVEVGRRLDVNIIAIDGAEQYGRALTDAVRDFSSAPQRPLVLVTIRSGRVDTCLIKSQLIDTPLVEMAVPALTDADIGGLLDTLERNNRLGVLRGKSRKQQVEVFQQKADRQLLVAMIEATSGKRFEEKVADELDELEGTDRVTYALVSIATALHFSPSREDILLASGDSSNERLNSIERLLRRHILIRGYSEDGSDRGVRSRHALIAQILLDEMVRRRCVDEPVRGLAFMASVKTSPTTDRKSRLGRFLKNVIHRDFLRNAIGVEKTRNLYGELEGSLSWDFHFWLQRGILELELDQLPLARQFLGQSRGLRENHPLVDTAWAHLLFKEALAAPGAAGAPGLVSDATTLLEYLIRSRGVYDQYPFHVLGSQGLAWARRGIGDAAAREAYVRNLLALLKEGQRRHPGSKEITQLLEDTKRRLIEGV